MEVAVRKKSLVCLAADRNTMDGLFELVNAVGPYIAALKTHVDLVDDWTPERWSEFCRTAKEFDSLSLKTENSPTLEGLVANRWRVFTIFANGQIWLRLT